MSASIGVHNAQKQEYDENARRSKAPTDKNIPDGVEDIILGNGVAEYKHMREVERKLDAIMTRKRLQMLDSNPRQGLSASVRRYRKMRIWISNTVENQPWQGGNELDDAQFDFNTGIEATYKVKIEGRLLPDKEADIPIEQEERADIENGSEAHKQQPSKPSPRIRLSHLFSQITIDFDRSKALQPEAMTAIEWNKRPKDGVVPPPSHANAEFDCLEFERKSDENINCTVNLYRDEPERFVLSKELADIVDSKEEDRTTILMRIWDYVKIMGLQQEEDKRMIRCDDLLRAVSTVPTYIVLKLDLFRLQCFHKDTIFFPELSQLILGHLSAPLPISLPYTIRVDPGFHASPSPTLYDVLVPVSHKALPDPFQPSLAILMEIDSLDAAIPRVIVALQQSKAKHSFLTSMARDPTNFMKRWISSQRRDMEIMLGDDQQQSEVWKKGGNQGIWASEQVRESVGLLVQRESR